MSYEYDYLSSIETSEERKRRLVEADIKQIEEALESEDESFVLRTHKLIDGKYQACINGWSKGMYICHPELGFVYDDLDIDTMKDNLETMKPKLMSYIEGWNENLNELNDKSDISVVVNNSINVDVSFNDARQKIEDMPGLTQYETEEIQKKIDELESISKETISKKRKWEKVKPILVFALDKGVDVAITIMGLILQMKLGM